MSLTAFRFAVDETKMTLTPLSSSVETVAIGSQSKLSSGDVQALTKSYSCAGRVATYGGGNALVSSIYKYIVNFNPHGSRVLEPVVGSGK